MTARRSLASPAQARIWFAEQLSPHGLEHVYPYAFRLSGPLDAAALCQAFSAVAARQAVLRTTFEATDHELYQVVHDAEPVAVPLLPLDGLPDGALPAHVRAEAERRFDLSNEPPLRARLYRLADDDHVLLVVVHHIATDSWSMDLLFADLATAYDAARHGREPAWRPLPMDYAGFAEWQHGDDTGDADLGYWREHLAGAPTLADLPLDRPRPAAQSLRGDHVSFTVPPADAERLAAAAREVRASPFMALLAVTHLTVARWCGQPDLVVGVPVAHRPLPDVEQVVGCFVNLLPIRLRSDERLTFRDLLAAAREAALDAYDHQASGFDRIVEAVAPARSLAHHPLVQVTLTDQRAAPVTLPGLTVTPIPVRLPVTRYELSFDVEPSPDGGLAFELTYATDLFDRRTAERIAESFTWALRTAPTAFSRPMCGLPPAPPAEPARPAPRPPRALLPGLARTAAAHPDRLAVASGDHRLSFAELDAAVSRVAGLLRAHGIGPGDTVGVCLPRDTRLLTGLLGVWRSGAAFVPLDPAYPQARLDFMLADSGATAVITAAETTPALPPGVTVVPIEQAATHPVPVTAEPAPSDLAYIIYTSGSTGRPKGVAVTHGSLAALLDALNDAGYLRPAPARVAWNASPCFDASLQQWARVCRGDSIIVLTEAERRDPELFAEALDRWQVTDVDVTPSHLDALTDALPSMLTGRPEPLRLLVGGEAITAPMWVRLRQWAAEGVAEAVNLYGPTECTVDAVAAWVADHDRPTIGRPLPGFTAYVLDPWQRPVPEGVIGELCLAGPQVALGYHGRPEQTAARFLPDPHATDGARMYRTGDRVRWSGGVLEYHGRTDGQIKVRGYRIELAEVEAALSEADGVQAAAVTPLHGGHTLGGVVAGGPDLDADAVRAQALAVLPGYMVPSVLRVVPSIPRTPAGKTDRQAVARLLQSGGAVADEPLGPIEQVIAQVWRDVLGVASVSAHDDFFALGGHSLLAIRLIGRLHQAVALRLPLAAVFAHPTVRRLAAHVETLIRAELAARAPARS